MKMDACYTVGVVLLCSLFHAVNAQEAILSVEAWAAIGLIGGIVVLIIGLIWIVFCIMLYRHHKEHRGDDEDSNVNKGKERKDKKQKKTQRTRREQLSQQTENTELAIQSAEAHGVHSLPLDDLYQAVLASSTLQPPGPTSHSHTESPLVSESAQPPEETSPTTEAVEPSNVISPRSSVPSPPSPKPSDSVPSTFESLFTPPTLAVEAKQGGGSHTGRKLHAQLPNVSSSRLRRLSDVEECDVQPEVSNFPLRYGQRRPSNANRKLSDNSDPFSFFNFEPSLLGRNHSEKRDMPYAKMENPRNYQDHIFGQLSSWPEFN